jgi:superfamily II DNA or RNA helicase/SOS-response transcriptional repressor LexA
MHMQNKSIGSFLTEKGFYESSSDATGKIFINSSSDTCIIIDTEICSLPDHHYVDYTSRQNNLMHRYSQVFRFLSEPSDSLESLEREITFFLEEEDDPNQVSRFGRNRTEQDIDPTMPEAIFEDCFIEAFGDAARHTIHREFPYYDCEGKRRFIDYAIFGLQKYAIELNGEAFHHPYVIKQAKYRSQLFKQNSLVRDGFKVFRWSTNGMLDREKFIQELKLFFGDPKKFKPSSWLKFKRTGEVQTIQLHTHQLEGLMHLEKQRRAGQNRFLIVLPTGIGKTEIFIKDIARLKDAKPDLKALVMVPTRNLRRQTIDRMIKRIPEYKAVVGSDSDYSPDSGKEIIVQTYATMHRNYYALAQDCFDYIVVDEAHHAVAHGLRRVIEHFTPQHLLGVTATPNRLDQKNLEEIFGEYESMLSLEDAVKRTLVPPIRCYRVKSNIDLSKVRFNGHEYVKSDLQRTLQVPSRDQLIAETLKKYFSGSFSNKQGVVFCVDINHAKRMAKMLKDFGITSLAVSGRNRKEADGAQADYNQGRVRFLCACDLLTEGWDAPQTSILVMARPTFSQVLYTQQLGRGLRKYPNKEALYVIDVVDNYGARLQPLSLHALFGIGTYRAFDNVIKPDTGGTNEELVVLDGLYEEARRIEPINIFNFEKLYGDYLNEEQLARELFVSTSTVKAWLKKGEIRPDVQYPFGRSMLSYFKPEQLQEIRKIKGLTEHTEETRKEDLLKFLEERDYVFSFKIIFLLSYLKTTDERGDALLPKILELYTKFYQDLLSKQGKNDKPNCPYNRAEILADDSEMQQSLLRNPFEKFERKRFFYHCKDLNYIAMDRLLIEQLKADDYAKIKEQMIQDLKNYYSKLQITIVEDDYNFLLGQKKSKPEHGKIIFLDSVRNEDKFKTALPFYELSVAAGEFLDSETSAEPEAWIDISGLSKRKSFDEYMFVSRIQGHSMEPIISDGSYCLFTRETAGTKNGRIVLAQKLGLNDVDSGASFSIKKYESSKVYDSDTEWRHENIILKAVNPDYEDIEISPEESDQFSIIAIYLETLG